MAGKVRPNSRYADSEIIVESGGDVVFVAPRRPLPTTDFLDNIVRTVRNNDRVELLSSEYYGTPEYGWIIADFNNLMFPDGPGQNSILGETKIILPSLQTIEEKIV